jgi:type III secretion system FlhB-like substrate exporter
MDKTKEMDYGDSQSDKIEGPKTTSELKDIPQDKIPKVLNDGYSDEYARAMEIAKNVGINIKDSKDIKKFSEVHLQDKQAKELFKARMTIQNELGANEYFTGNGLTAYTGRECDNAYGAVETFTFDKNPQTIGNMMSDGRMKLLDTSPVR